MNIKNILLSGMMLAACAANAQEAATKTETVFEPHWYVQLQGGGQYTLGEIGFSDLLSPTMQAGVGYNFSPVVGARLAIGAWQSKGGINVNTDIRPNLAPQYKYKWNYVAPTLELTFNMSNLVCGYNPTRLVNVGLHAGLGANIGWGNDEVNELKGVNGALEYYENLDNLWDGTATRFVVKAGASVDFRINDAFSVGAEINANVLNDNYNSKGADNADWYFNALVGVKYNLGKTHSTKVVPVPQPEIRYVDRVVEKVVEVPAKAEEKPAPNVVENKKETLRRDIFFAIRSNEIKGDNVAKLREVADFLKANPEAKVNVCGYADKGTGNNAINDRMGQKRAQIVVNQLVNKYGIARNRINSESKGSRVQPFAENNKNRVTICIAE